MTGVMGFLAQCEICPQKAILTDQTDGWVCPRCTEVTAPAYSKCTVPGCISCHGQVNPAGGFRPPAGPPPWMKYVDEDYPLGSVEG